MPTPAQNAATAKYAKEHLRQYVVRVNRRLDPEMVEWLDSRENVAGYIKELVKKDMESHITAV